MPIPTQTRKHDTAFPIYDSYGEVQDILPEYVECKGLTKREYFAAMALQGLLASGKFMGGYTSFAVEYADELIKELNKTNSNEKQHTEEQPEN